MVDDEGRCPMYPLAWVDKQTGDKKRRVAIILRMLMIVLRPAMISSCYKL